MNNPHPQSLSEHTFGREHFTPPPLAQELAEPQALQAAAPEDEWELLQHIRNVGIGPGRTFCLQKADRLLLKGRAGFPVRGHDSGEIAAHDY